MKRWLTILVGVAVAAAASTITPAAMAENLRPATTVAASRVNAALTTQPAGIHPSSTGGSQHRTPPYRADDLNSVASSIQVSRQRSPRQKSINPLDFFKVPSLPSGVKVTVQRY